MSDYLAMYLSLEFHMGGPIFVPVRHFAESTQRLAQDIMQNKLHTKLDEANAAIGRIMAPNKVQVAVLLDSTLPGRNVILKRPLARGNMVRVGHELQKLFAPPAAPVMQPNPDLRFCINFGMKNIRTQYPDPFVEARNFTSGMGTINFRAQIHRRAAIIGMNFVLALLFDHASGLIVFGQA
jgi:hypothetical protein